MLGSLKIKNYALIDNLELVLSDWLTIITGETGAGKSIILGALSLLMGGRADVKTIRDKGLKSEIEAGFIISPELRDLIKSKLGEEQFDLSNPLILRREISPAGRSRTFVNDTPVNLAVMEELSKYLIDIHSQNSNLAIADGASQLEIIDEYASHKELQDEYKEEFIKYVNLKRDLDRLRKESAAANAEMAAAKIRLDDLKELAPKRGEQKELTRLFDFLSDAGEIKEHLATSCMLMSDAERGDGAVERLEESLHRLESLGDTLPSTNDDSEESTLKERLASVIIELKDIHATLESLASEAECDPRRLEEVELRMGRLFNACTKYGVADADALVDIMNRDARTLAAGNDSVERIKGVESLIFKQGLKLKEAADRLTDSRQKGAWAFSAFLTEEARKLGLPNLKFEAKVERKKKMAVDGQDSVTFMASFNKNQQPMPLAKVASGGEMSRLMLAIKSILVRRLGLSTVIFDEVDTGVSGEIADRMGRMMQQMSHHLQVIVITHLPQVASRGETHFKVFKTDNDVKTVTQIERLEGKARVEEIARMLSGSRIEATALSNAETLLNNNSIFNA